MPSSKASGRIERPRAGTTGSRSRPALSPADRQLRVAAVIAAYRSGMSCSAVGRKLGLADSTVHYHLVNAGVALRKPGQVMIERRACVRCGIAKPPAAYQSAGRGYTKSRCKVCDAEVRRLAARQARAQRRELNSNALEIENQTIIRAAGKPPAIQPLAYLLMSLP